MARLAIVVPIAIGVVLVLLYMALGSARSAGSVLLVAPASLTGGAFLLALSGVNLSVSAMIGFIALLGQVALACLLVLGAIDDLRRDGASLREAVVRGAVMRFRPVLMTTLLAMLGLLPMAISTGMGSETQKPFALVLIGGMVTTCAAALFVLPAVYTLVAGAGARRRDEEDEDETEASA